MLHVLLWGIPICLSSRAFCREKYISLLCHICHNPCLGFCPEDSHINPFALYVKKNNTCTLDLLSNPNPRKLLTVAIQCRTSHFKNVFSVKKILILLFYTINCKQNVDILTDFSSPKLKAQGIFGWRGFAFVQMKGHIHYTCNVLS